MDQLVESSTTTCFGTVTYEAGIQVLDITGWVREEGPWVVVYGNPDLPVDQQRRTAVLMTRVIEMDVRPSA